MSYGAWLADQPKAFQDKELGEKRAARFRSGDLVIDKYRDYTGETMDLEEVEALESLVFDDEL